MLTIELGSMFETSGGTKSVKHNVLGPFLKPPCDCVEREYVVGVVHLAAEVLFDSFEGGVSIMPMALRRRLGGCVERRRHLPLQTS